MTTSTEAVSGHDSSQYQRIARLLDLGNGWSPEFTASTLVEQWKAITKALRAAGREDIDQSRAVRQLLGESAGDVALEKVASMLDVSAASLGSASTPARDYARDVTRDHARRVRALKSKPARHPEDVGAGIPDGNAKKRTHAVGCIRSGEDHPEGCYVMTGSYAAERGHDWPWAKARLEEGQEVRRKVWPPQLFWRNTRDGIVNSMGYAVYVAPGDDCGAATDWEVVDWFGGVLFSQAPSVHDFGWALQQMRAGNRVKRKAWDALCAYLKGGRLLTGDCLVSAKYWYPDPECLLATDWEEAR